MAPTLSRTASATRGQQLTARSMRKRYEIPVTSKALWDACRSGRERIHDRPDRPFERLLPANSTNCGGHRCGLLGIASRQRSGFCGPCVHIGTNRDYSPTGAAAERSSNTAATRTTMHCQTEAALVDYSVRRVRAVRWTRNPTMASNSFSGSSVAIAWLLSSKMRRSESGMISCISSENSGAQIQS
jgi:hypothetical protein